LFRINLADLSPDVFEAREKLRQMLGHALAWNAIVLFDNVDIIMEKRTFSYANKDSLVSMFMTEIENFEGLMFLVTSRVDNFDGAASHLFHMMLDIPMLDNKAQLMLKQAKANGEAISQTLVRYLEDYYAEKDKLAANACQIKNGVRMAITLARLDERPLSIDHIKSVLQSEDYSLLKYREQVTRYWHRDKD
jgi:SpoVK/Ycf46/Vps4 family AAA+-type ATPase